MEARRDRVIEALQDMSPSQTGTRLLPPGGDSPKGGIGVLPMIHGQDAHATRNRLFKYPLRMSVAAALVLGAGVIIGRATAPRPVDVEQLRADLQASLVASLRPAVQESVLAEVDRRLESGLAASEASLRDELAEQLRGDLQLFATQFTAGSDRRMDKRFAEFVQLIEEARLKDRQQVAKALDRIEQNRVRDKAQFGMGLQSVAALTAKATPAIQH